MILNFLSYIAVEWNTRNIKQLNRCYELFQRLSQTRTGGRGSERYPAELKRFKELQEQAAKKEVVTLGGAKRKVPGSSRQSSGETSKKARTASR